MNGRTAKLLRRYSRVQGVSLRSAKRSWLKTPRPLRARVRREIQSSL